MKMMGRLCLAAALALTALLPTHAPASARAAVATSDWGNLADLALTRLAAADDGRQTAFTYAYAASAAGNRYGWDAPATTAYLAKVFALRLANGGWAATYGGTTVYTVTLADHVGPVLLEAYQGGADGVGAGDVSAVAVRLVSAAQWVTVGKCVSYLIYSPSADCVHNQNSAVAAFLVSVREAGIMVPGADALVAQIVRRETYAFNGTVNGWPYSDTQSAVQDADHGSLSAEAAMALYPPVGRLAITKIMSTTYAGASEINAPLAHLRAGAFDCARADAFSAEAYAYLAAQSDPMRLAQVARWAARLAVVC